jgi:hypothetical protein
MKSEQIKEITDQAAERVVAALQAGQSEALTAYLKAIGRFHRYSLHNVEPSTRSSHLQYWLVPEGLP